MKGKFFQLRNRFLNRRERERDELKGKVFYENSTLSQRILRKMILSCPIMSVDIHVYIKKSVNPFPNDKFIPFQIETVCRRQFQRKMAKVL